ncbi:phosphotransferase [Kribbella shirazensis]|uniref:Aminoglycoside phosphotransferase domain-containing protein n=1 Tax=Kribbella shirazensis TaxID=1105143 RepID=A0A7X5VGP0_9ACTN|nr:hypothetical protein [Kribbella shirazensis]
MSEALNAPVTNVDVVELFDASAALVARLKISCADRPDLSVIGKYAKNAGATAARREIRFFERLAPHWAHPAPRLLGFHDTRQDVLLLSEDLEAGGYRLVGGGVSDAQLRGTIETLVDLHARFWNDIPVELLDDSPFELSVTSAAQALPREVIPRHAEALREEARQFFATATDLERGERTLFEAVVEAWEHRFQLRVADSRALTLIHGDFHFLGNVFFAPGDSRPKVIDWSELKAGLGPHDLAYCLTVVPAEDRPARDRALLRAYWDGLRSAGVDGYSWELCEWDFRFSTSCKLLQAVIQRSVKWYRTAAAEIEAMGSRANLAEPPPVR